VIIRRRWGSCCANTQRFSVTGIQRKVVPYSITSVGLGADPGLLVVNPHNHGGRLLLLSTRPVVTFPAKEIIPWPVPNYCILFGDRDPRPLRNGAQSELEAATCESQVRCPANSASASPYIQYIIQYTGIYTVSQKRHWRCAL